MTELMTGKEVAARLRLDELKRPDAALAHLRRTRKLKGTKIGRGYLYTAQAVEDLIAAQTKGLESDGHRAYHRTGKSPRR